MQAETKRKLIDIKAPVFNCLALKAKRKGVSLKRYIEDLLEEDAYEEHRAAPAGVTDGKILPIWKTTGCNTS